MTTTTIPTTPKKRSIALILSPIGLLLLSAARLIIVADYNTTTAVTIASSGGYVNTLLGSVIPLVPIFAPYLALTLLLFKRFLLSIMVFVFAAFITPSPLTLPQVISLGAADWHHLVEVVLSFGLLHSQIIIIIGIVILSAVLITPLLAQHREIAEVAGMIVIAALAAALLIPNPGTRSITPTPLRLENASASLRSNENHVVALTATYWPVAIAVAISIALISSSYRDHRFSRLLSATVAIVATFALFPYVVQIYPVPHHSSYYSQVLHELWLPAEKITMQSGRAYYGYILYSDAHWNTVLRTNRSGIIYLQSAEVARRSVCEPRSTPKPVPYPPLIPLLYTQPAPTPPCASRPITMIPSISILSHGQSLHAISLKVYAWPYRIILLTNAMLGYHLSGAMRRYEYRHNWYAPTPIGQRLWYGTDWPKVRPQPISKQNFPCPFGTIIEDSGMMICR